MKTTLKRINHYKQANNTGGLVSMARLVWTGKRQDPAMSLAQAIEIFKHAVKKSPQEQFSTLLFCSKKKNPMKRYTSYKKRLLIKLIEKRLQCCSWALLTTLHWSRSK